MSDMREETEDEISLLDLAITIKENIKLLVLAPVAAGVVALGASLVLRPAISILDCELWLTLPSLRLRLVENEALRDVSPVS